MTTKEEVVCPGINTVSLNHINVPVPEAVNVELPVSQKVKVPLMVGVAGIGFTVTTAGAEKAEGHPAALVTLTV